MGSLKILIPVHVFFPSHFYGTETYTLELAKCLKRMGHDPIILTAVPKGEKGTGEFYSQYDYDGLTVYAIDMNVIPCDGFLNSYYNRYLIPFYKKIINEIKPDIIHVTHLINHTSVLLEVAKSLWIPVVATLTDFFGICCNSKLSKYDGTLCKGPNRRSTNCLVCNLKGYPFIPFLKQYQNNTYVLRFFAELMPYITKLTPKKDWHNVVDDIFARYKTLLKHYQTYQVMIAPSDFLYEAYADNLFYKEKLKKINFGINLNLIKGYQTPKTKDDKNIRFGYIGQIDHHKGIDLLINAFNTLSPERNSLVIYGPSDQNPGYMKELTRLSEGKPIEFKKTFPSDELPKKLNGIDVLVIPSRWYENSPLILLYALACKTPVIVSDVKGMTEFVKDGINGFTFALNDVKDLAVKMQHVSSNPELVQELSKNATYSKDVMDHANEVFLIYDHVLRANAKNPRPAQVGAAR